MKISLELILSETNLEPESSLSENPHFSTFELYTPGVSNGPGQPLLVAKLSEALAAPKKDGQFFLCVRDQKQGNAETKEVRKNICVVKRTMEQAELLNAVQSVFHRIQRWVMQMHESVLSNRGLQDLMNLCEPIFGNHIAIMDATFNLLAYTKNIETDDEASRILMEHGYHPEETIRRFQQHRRIEQYEVADENMLIVSRDHLISKYDTVKKIYKHNNAFFAKVVMVCNGKSYSVAMAELFNHLLKNITYYFEREQPPFTQLRQFESFFGALAGRTIREEEDAKNRAKLLLLPFNGTFELNLIVFNDIMNIPAARLTHDLSSRLKNAVVSTHNRDILILYNTDNHESDAETRKKQLFDLLCDFSCNCGVSNTFGSLWDFAAAFEQAHAAVLTGERLRLAKKEDAKFRFYTYEDYYLYHMVANSIDSSPGVFTNSFAFTAIKTLKMHDKKNNANLLETLSAYLGCERNATTSSEQLHMHRNTVLYHIKKIEGILGVSLENPDIRMKLTIGLKARDMDRI